MHPAYPDFHLQQQRLLHSHRVQLCRSGADALPSSPKFGSEQCHPDLEILHYKKKAPAVSFFWPFHLLHLLLHASCSLACNHIVLSAHGSSAFVDGRVVKCDLVLLLATLPVFLNALAVPCQLSWYESPYSTWHPMFSYSPTRSSSAPFPFPDALPPALLASVPAFPSCPGCGCSAPVMQPLPKSLLPPNRLLTNLSVFLFLL